LNINKGLAKMLLLKIIMLLYLGLILMAKMEQEIILKKQGEA
jgi:hypothetical protein